MSRTRPFLTGAAVSAAAMYFSLQYHVVRSDAGIRILPRTPQHSLALAWADVRTWTPSQWTDRVELARAAMAAGASDLISDSVKLPLQQEVSESASTLNDLRDFLNRTRQDARQSLDKLAEARRPELPTITPDTPRLPSTPSNPPKTLSTTETDDSELSLDHEEAAVVMTLPTRQSVPLPSDAAVTPPADPFRPSPTPEKPNAPSRFSAKDIREGLAALPDAVVPDAASTLLQQAEEMERRIFGDVSGKTSGPIQPSPANSGRLAAELEQSARNLLEELRKTGSPEVAASENDQPWLRKTIGAASAAARAASADSRPTVTSPAATSPAATSPAATSPAATATPATAGEADAAGETATDGSDAAPVFDPFLEADSR
ncbi:MAG: hypothetical protein RLZZ458_2130 [Planctomycetota bacterium]